MEYSKDKLIAFTALSGIYLMLLIAALVIGPLAFVISSAAGFVGMSSLLGVQLFGHKKQENSSKPLH